MNNLNDPTQPCVMCDGEGRVPSKIYAGYCYNFDNDPPAQTCKICNGEGTVYYIDGEKERFNMLAERWEIETMNYSSPETNHPCFVAMNKMKSKEAIVWVLERMQKGDTLLMMLLGMWIKKKDKPTTEEMRGKIGELTKAWIKWGIEKKIIEKK